MKDISFVLLLPEREVGLLLSIFRVYSLKDAQEHEHAGLVDSL